MVRGLLRHDGKQLRSSAGRSMAGVGSDMAG
jgi:hypothetical protein